LFVAALAKTSDSRVNHSGAQALANPAYRLQVYASEAHPPDVVNCVREWSGDT
jgi:hypothetical protein